MFKAPAKKLNSAEEEQDYLRSSLVNAVAHYKKTNREIDEDVIRTLFRMLILEYAEFTQNALLHKGFTMSEHDQKKVGHELEIAKDKRETLRTAINEYGVRNTVAVLAREGKDIEYERALKVLADLVYDEMMHEVQLST